LVRPVVLVVQDDAPDGSVVSRAFAGILILQREAV
jgi:hypothetical protein